MVGQGEGKKFVCRCGYKEKLSSFNKRKKERRKKGSYKDVKKFMKDKDDEPFNTALADKLKGFLKMNRAESTDHMALDQSSLKES